MNEPKALTKISPDELPAAIIDEPQVTDAEAERAMKQSGLVMLSAEAVRSLSVLGAFEKGLGIARTQRGKAVAAQSRVDESMAATVDIVTGRRKIGGKPAKFDQVIRAGQTVATLARALTDSQRFTLELEEFLPPNERQNRESSARNKTFAAGAAVTPHTTIYAHNVQMNQPTPVADNK